MSQFATRRLIDAADSLDPADRALLNIWVNRGLDDAAVARMTGMSADAIAERRERIIDRLSALLGLPPEEIRSALAEIGPAGDGRPGGGADAPAANGAAASASASAEHTAPSPNGAPPAELAAPAGAHADLATSSRRRWWWVAVALLVVVGAVVLVVSLAASSSGRHRGAARAARSTARTPSARTVTSAPPTTPPAAGPAGASLVALPGGSAQASGIVTVARTGAGLRLDLRVSNLPALSNGHYEVWLYNSLVNSVALGPLPAGTSHRSLLLPPHARRYHWIDISVQPGGDVFNSGGSALRSANPLFVTKVKADQP